MGKFSTALEKAKQKKRQSLVSFPKSEREEAIPTAQPEQRMSGQGGPIDTIELSLPEEAAPHAGQSQKTNSVRKKVPVLPSANFPQELVTLSMPNSMEAEQFKMLRTSILFPKVGEPPKTIMVTSVSANEGKSFIASNLAVSIAQNVNNYVLLIDGDMRRPSIHQYFGYQHQKGLSEYLTNNIRLENLILNTTIEKLSILPSGSSPRNPSELLSSKKMSELISEVKSRYDDRYIIFDSPPPKITSEAKVLARQVDGIIVVIKYGNASVKDVDELVGLVGKEKVIGVVINQFDKRFFSSYYNQKYGSYYR